VNRNDTFVDEARIVAISGDGGNGCMSFRREKYVPRGGPDGGDGGRGGDVVLVADPGLGTLLDLQLRPQIRAGRGGHGGGARKTGADGRDAIVRVPVGTCVYPGEASSEPAAAGAAEPLADLAAPDRRLVVARGGRGGRGNARFATPTRQAPDFAEPGRPGETRELRLALKLLADVGLVGLPNAGKSTLLGAISAARPRVAAYPFTTLRPSLGVAERGDLRFVVADIPGLIRGASGGAGLGHRFLRHIERTRVLVHLLDLGAWIHEGRDPVSDYEAIRAELGRYSPALLERPELVALNKVDLLPDPQRIEPIEAALRERGVAVLRLSGATGEGRSALLRALAERVDRARRAEWDGGAGREDAEAGADSGESGELRA
jgi:GTP-binding protein